MEREMDEEIDRDALSILFQVPGPDSSQEIEEEEEENNPPHTSRDAAAVPTTAPVEQRHHLISIGATVTIRQLPSRGLSFQLWPAALSFLSFLDRSPSALLLPRSSHHILELGSGTGLVGIALAAVLGAHVTLTDLPHVLPNLRSNALANADLAASRGGSLSVRQLRWGSSDDAASLGSPLPVSVVVASDVVYYGDLVDPLLETLRVFVRGEVVFVMAHLRRWRKTDAVFFRKARKAFDVATVHVDPPQPESRTGVAIYRFTARRWKTKEESAL